MEMLDPISGVPVKVNPALSGSKNAVSIAGEIHVSPAMFELMRHAEGDELRRLLEAIKVIDLESMRNSAQDSTK